MRKLAMNPHAKHLGRLGGRSKSPAKSDAARKNGKLGGRPKKAPPVAQEAPETSGL